MKIDAEDRAVVSRGRAPLTEEVLRRACLSYGRDDWSEKWRRAERIRTRSPICCPRSGRIESSLEAAGVECRHLQEDHPYQ